MNDYFLNEENANKVTEHKRTIVQHEYNWKKFKCPTCGKEKKFSSIILKLYSAPKCCGKEMECISTIK